jgi:hypothetical protein
MSGSDHYQSGALLLDGTSYGEMLAPPRKRA